MGKAGDGGGTKDGSEAGRSSPFTSCLYLDQASLMNRRDERQEGGREGNDEWYNGSQEQSLK